MDAGAKRQNRESDVSIKLGRSPEVLGRRIGGDDPFRVCVGLKRGHVPEADIKEDRCFWLPA
jgi:hypothetical protein